MNDHNDNWETLISELPVETSPREAHREQLRADALRAFDESLPHPAASRLQQTGRILMKYKVPHWTIACLVITALTWMAPGGGTSAFAVENLVNRIVSAKTARWDMVVNLPGEEPQVIKVSLMDGRCRQEFPTFTQILDWNSGKMLSLIPDGKQAIEMTTFEDGSYSDQANMFANLSDGLKGAMKDPDRLVESLGEKTLGGRTVVGFRFHAVNRPIDVWADPKTELPVEIVMNVDESGTTVVLSNYEINVALDESLFSTDVPAGYTVLDEDLSASPDEASLLKSLRTYADISGGKFPEDLSPTGTTDAMADYVEAVFEQLDEIPTNGELSQELTEKIVQFNHGFSFVTVLAARSDSDVHYNGKGARLNDVDRPILWYRPEGKTITGLSMPT